jgi:ATP-dependent DNA helicase DinG
MLFVPPPGFPAPQAPAFGLAARQLMLDLVLLSRGRALLLFTSIVAMRAARDFLTERLPFPLLAQGEAPRQALLDAFQQDTHSVLLAVASFWEGVDVPGEALSCVIIDKLPFEVPSDPVMMARMDAIQAQGGNPFFDFQVPRAILALRQGVGRLMRKATDRGVLAILDARLTSKGYGRLFLESLPPSPITRDLAAIATFFAEED